MGFGGISIWQLLIILVIVVLLFGTKKLRNMGGDLGSAIKNFRQSVKDGEAEGDTTAGKPGEESEEGKPLEDKGGRVFESQATEEKSKEGERQT